MEHVQAQSQMRAADFFHQRRRRLQIVRIRRLGLKLQRQPHPMLAGLLGSLLKRHPQPIEILLSQRPLHVAGNHQRFDSQRLAQLQPFGEMIPMLAPRIALRNQQSALKASRRHGHVVLLQELPHVIDAVRLQIRLELSQPNFNRLAMPRRIIFHILLKRRVQRANLAERGDHLRTPMQ